jgi:hypothetical protein
MFKKIVINSILTTLIFFMTSGISFASQPYCPTNYQFQTNNCSSVVGNCEDYFVSTGQQYTTTYCTQCSVCDAGANDCIQGALGCNECNIATGYDDGVWCAGTSTTSPCYNGTQACQ